MDVHLLRFYLDLVTLFIICLVPSAPYLNLSWILGNSFSLRRFICSDFYSPYKSGLRAHIILSMARIHVQYSCYYYVVALIISRARHA